MPPPLETVPNQPGNHAAAVLITAAVPAPPPESRLVVSLNVASGMPASRAARSAYHAALRPRGPLGPSPRYTPAIRRHAESSGPRDAFPAGLAEPAPPASRSWAGGRWDWPQELKPFFSDLLLAIVILGYMAHLCNEDVYVAADDAKDWFHQFALAVLQCWTCGMFRLDPVAFTDGDLDTALSIVLARCLEMGVSPSSNIAQRTLTEMLTSLSQRFAAEEEPYWREMERRFPRFGGDRHPRGSIVPYESSPSRALGPRASSSWFPRACRSTAPSRP